MAGTIVASTLSDGTTTSSVTDAVKGSARAWVNFNGSGTVSTNQTIRASYNVSSVFKNGTGNYTINFTNALVDTNYAATVTATSPSADPNFTTGVTAGESAATTTSLTVKTGNYSVGVADREVICVAVFR